MILQRIFYAAVLCGWSLGITSQVFAEETIEFYAEHLLEVPMDARYLSMPLTPSTQHDKQGQLQLGYAKFDAGKMQNSIPMVGISYFAPINNHWGLMFSGFYDRYQFSGSRGNAKGGVLTVNAAEVPDEFSIDLHRVDGTGTHQGEAITMAYTPDEGLHWQLGIAKTQLDIHHFTVEFTTQDLPENFEGSFEYAGKYNITSVFLSVEMQPRVLTDQFTYRPHLVIVRNSPRVGFKGRFTSDTFDYQGDTNSAGHGNHIPDSYLGIGVMFTHKASGIGVDLGATLYNYLVEPNAHSGIETPLLLNISVPF